MNFLRRKYLKIVAILLLILLSLSSLKPHVSSAQTSTTITIGGFDLSRGNGGSVKSGFFLDNFRARLNSANFPNTTFVLTEASTLTASYLNTLDILVIASAKSNTSAITPLSALIGAGSGYL